MIRAIYVRAIQPVLVGRLTLIPLTSNLGQIRQSVMLDKAFMIGNGIGRQVFYQTWSLLESVDSNLKGISVSAPNVT